MFKKYIILFILLSISITYTIWGINLYEEVIIGTIEVGDEVFVHHTYDYPIYSVKGQRYLLLNDIQLMGITIEEQNNILYLRAGQVDAQPSQVDATLLQDQEVSMAQTPLYCGNIRSYVLQTGEIQLIPLGALEGIWSISQDKDVYWSESYIDQMDLLYSMNEIGITNETTHVLPVTCIHLYWDGLSYQQTEESLLLEAFQLYNWQLNSEWTYITTYVSQLSGITTRMPSIDAYGQRHIETFKQYSQSIRFRELNAKFPSYRLLAQMKYPVGALQSKETVDLWRSEKHYYFWVIDHHGNKHQVPYNSIRIIGEQSIKWLQVTTKDIEDFITLSHIPSQTNYLVWTDVYRQRTYVLKKDNDSWHLEKNFICSTGKDSNLTPLGLYEVQYTIPYIGVEKGYRCKYALVFFRDYMYHSILFDKTGSYIKSGQYELGRRASHGCVRLSEKDSAWLYKNIPVGTAVWIR